MVVVEDVSEVEQTCGWTVGADTEVVDAVGCVVPDHAVGGCSSYEYGRMVGICVVDRCVDPVRGGRREV